ncbi:hypothetical protein ACJJTF_20210 (plasmid) [Bacillus velezensis]|uniref:hypothetical protein n=2 Tax=Bacillus subtilis group TaxID=653685 RepID=UPI002AF80910|nr:hypothetical protein [Streptococcus agalactiae]
MTQKSLKVFINQMFQDQHNDISSTGLIPVNQMMEQKPNLKQQIDVLCELLELPDNKNLYYRLNSVLEEYVYLDDCFYFVFWSLEKDYIEQFVSSGFIKKREYCKQLLKDKNFKQLLFINDKAVGFLLFEFHYDQIPLEDRKALFIHVYSRSEYGFSELDVEMVEEILLLPTPEEFKLPSNVGSEVLTIYRGQGSKSTHYDEALSWTLSEEVAHFFANRFSDNGAVYRGKVKRENVKGYIEREEEVLVFPESVFDIEKVQV